MGPCDVCGEQPQAIQIGNMATGEQIFACVGCAARWGLDFAKATLPAEEIAAQVGPLFVTPAREDLHDEAKAVSGKRGRKSKTAPQTTQGTAVGSAEAPAAAADE